MPAYVPITTVERPPNPVKRRGRYSSPPPLIEKYDVQGNLVPVEPEEPPPRESGSTPIALRTRGTAGLRNRKAEVYANFNSYNTALGKLYQDCDKAFTTLCVASKESNTLTFIALKTTFTHLLQNSKTLMLQYQYIKDETEHLRPKEVEEATVKHTRLVTLTQMLYRYSTVGDVNQLWKKTWKATRLTVTPDSPEIPSPAEFEGSSDSGSECGDVKDVELTNYLVDTTPLPQNHEHVNPVRHPRAINNPKSSNFVNTRLHTTVQHASRPPPPVQRSDV